MRSATPASRYDAALRILHWAIAAIIVAAIALGVAAFFLRPGSPPRVEILTIHKSLGMTALALVAVRVVWRLSVDAPAYSAGLGPLSRFGAHLVHVGLYALMIAMPVSGYLDSVAGGHDAPWFGVFTFPAAIGRSAALAHRAGFAHFYLAWTIGAALALHLAAVAWHAWVKRDEVFARMWFSRANG